MPYIKETCIAGKVMEIRKYYSARYGKRGKAGPRTGQPSPEAVRKANERRQETELRRRINANFEAGKDALVTLNWKSKGVSPDEMQKEVKNFFRRLAYRYRKAGKELKYIYCLEIGSKGARHVHAVISDADLGELSETWRAGPINVQPLWPDGEYGKIASYFTKYAKATEETLSGNPDLTELKIGRRFNCSKNLVKPEVKKEVVMAETFREQPSETIREFRLVKDSVRSGVSDLTGYCYQTCVYTRDQYKPPRRKLRRRKRKRGQG